MFTATAASKSMIPALRAMPTKLSMGVHSDRLMMACFQIMNRVRLF
jgi:hypothetical protein